MTALVCTATVTPTPASARESSSSTRMYERKSAPAPPYSSGMQTPMKPSSASLPNSSRGKPCRPVPVGGVRLDLRLRELPRQRLDLPLVGGKLEVHRAASIVVAGLASGTAQGTLPWSWYSDPELLRREQERIFRHGWQYAGPAEHAAATRRLLHLQRRRRAGRGHARPRRRAARPAERLPPPRLARRAGPRQPRDAAVPLPRVDLRARRPAALRTTRPGARARRDLPARAGGRGLGPAAVRPPRGRSAAAGRDARPAA